MSSPIDTTSLVVTTSPMNTASLVDTSLVVEQMALLKVHRDVVVISPFPQIPSIAFKFAKIQMGQDIDYLQEKELIHLFKVSLVKQLIRI